MALTKFTIQPNQSGYTVADGKEVLSVKLDGGRSRFRKDVLNSARMVNVQWTLDENEFLYFRMFYNSTTLSGSLPFLIDLILDSPDLTEHEAYFMPESVSISQVVARTYTVSAMLEVKPDIPDIEYETALVMLINEYGSLEAAEEVIDQLAILTNIDLPGSLPG